MFNLTAKPLYKEVSYNLVSNYTISLEKLTSDPGYLYFALCIPKE